MTINEIEKSLEKQFSVADDVAFFNQKKVIEAFRECRISNTMFSASTGYGYDDQGRDNLARVFAKIFKAQSALISPIITCGTHAISMALFGLLRPGDVMLSISGMPYDTLTDTLFGKGNGSLEDFKVRFEKIDLVSDEFDFDQMQKKLKKLKPKVVYIQRSKGYTSRKALSIDQIEKACAFVKKICPKSCILVDNCYGEFVEKKEPIEVGADVVMGSLIKNAGGGIAPTGGYIAGKAEAIDLIAKRFTCPSLGTEVGSYESTYRTFFQGLFMAPHTVAQAVKGSLLIGKVMEEKGYKAIPSTCESSSDIVRSIVFGDQEKLVKFVQTIQKYSPIDSFAVPMPWDMPGYNDQVIMAAGTFVSGSSIELSCDGPIRPPYVAYFQGGLTYEHVKMVAEKLLEIID